MFFLVQIGIALEQEHELLQRKRIHVGHRQHARETGEPMEWYRKAASLHQPHWVELSWWGNLICGAGNGWRWDGDGVGGSSQ